ERKVSCLTSILPPIERVTTVRFEAVPAIGRQISVIGLTGGCESIDWIVEEPINSRRSTAVFVRTCEPGIVPIQIPEGIVCIKVVMVGEPLVEHKFQGSIEPLRSRGFRGSICLVKLEIQSFTRVPDGIVLCFVQSQDRVIFLSMRNILSGKASGQNPI